MSLTPEQIDELYAIAMSSGSVLAFNTAYRMAQEDCANTPVPMSKNMAACEADFLAGVASLRVAIRENMK